MESDPPLDSNNKREKMVGRIPQALFPRAAGKPRRRKRHAFADVTNGRRQKTLRTKQNRRGAETFTIHQFPDDFVTSDYQYRGEPHDVDKYDDDCVTGYIDDMYSYFEEREMKKQPRIDAYMRAKIVDWLIKVNDKLNLPVEALYLAVDIVDRFLDKVSVRAAELHFVVAMASLMIAAKFEDRSATFIMSALIQVSGNACPRSKLVKMERYILEKLRYEIFVPTPFTFLTRYLKCARVCEETCKTAHYILDSTLVSYSLLSYLPSQLASAAVCIARYSMGYHPWSATLLENTGYCEEEIIPIAREINNERRILSKRFTSVKEKYNNSYHFKER